MMKPILICGPTASGKSALGIELAKRLDGCIINADALQVYNNWRILTARPSVEDENLISHRLYGHVDGGVTYSVGAWLKDVKDTINQCSEENKVPIVIGGTGLYFTALTTGLAEIPETPDDVRAIGNSMRARSGPNEFVEYLTKHDPETLAKLDINNPMRLQRAWEVLVNTGRGLSSWHTNASPPILPLEGCIPIVLNSNKKWLNGRISKRFDLMLELGALDECRKVLEAGYDASLPSSKALGAIELISYLEGNLSLDEARELATIATNQFAKRQRTWFRSKMKLWQAVDISELEDMDLLINQII